MNTGRTVEISSKDVIGNNDNEQIVKPVYSNRIMNKGGKIKGILKNKGNS